MPRDLRPTLLILAVLLIGCGGQGGSDPGTPPISEPPESADSTQTSSHGNPARYFLGFWDIKVSADHQSAEVVSNRVAGMHLNLLPLLEDPACGNCLKIGDIEVCHTSVWSADVTLTHPFPMNGKMTGFDVRGILITDGDRTLPVSQKTIAWGSGVPVVQFPDGYTSVFNPSEFPEGGPGPAWQKYSRGTWAKGANLGATLNPFVAYARDVPRRMFLPGTDETREIRFRIPNGPFEFGYAVDACWHYVGFVANPVFDFPPDANCLEAYDVAVSVGEGLEPDAVTSVSVDVTVSDHQGLGTIASVTAEAPDLFAGTVELTYTESLSDKRHVFSGTITNELGASKGEYPLLIRVVDTEQDENLGQIDAWQVVPIRLKAGWAHGWGGTGSDYAYGVATDGDGSIYVTGGFFGTVDFDPVGGVEERTADHADAFLCKYSSTGELMWVRTWGAVGYDYGRAVAVDGMGNVFVTGEFEESTDFDPGPGTDVHTSQGYGDMYVSKFDSAGEFQWGRTWGGGVDDYAYGVVADDSGNTYVAGEFEYSADFDPGPGVDEHEAVLWSDCSLSAFDPNGEFRWAATWGGEGDDKASGVSMDGAGDVYVTGSFAYTVDFDPGPGVDEHMSKGYDDAFLSKLTSAGEFVWARTWGSLGYYEHDKGLSVTSDTSGNLYVSGFYEGTADFDPGEEVYELSTNGGYDAFLSKLDSAGDFIWARSWGGIDNESGWSVAVDGLGSVLVTGFFEHTVDFDPGPGARELEASGSDVFLSKLDEDGVFLWARGWGGAAADYGEGVATDTEGNSYVAGYIGGDIVDFDPGPGTEFYSLKGYSDAFLSMLPPDGVW